MKRIRMSIDILMMLLLPLLMAYSLIGEDLHEVLGIIMSLLFIGHHILNRQWWKTLTKGTYNGARILNTVVNLLLVAFMILQPVSGLLMSKHVLKGISLPGAAGLLRTIHMPLAYWGFVLMSFHLGLHGRIIVANLARRLDQNGKKIASFGMAAVACYGGYAFFKRGIGEYLLMKTMFAFFDFNESRIVFLMDYIAMLIGIAFLAYWIQAGLIHLDQRRRSSLR